MTPASDSTARLAGSVDLGLPEITPVEARTRGARTMVIGIANSGGYIPENWLPGIVAAIEAGLDVASGMHQRLADNPALAGAAKRAGVRAS